MRQRLLKRHQIAEQASLIDHLNDTAEPIGRQGSVTVLGTPAEENVGWEQREHQPPFSPTGDFRPFSHRQEIADATAEKIEGKCLLKSRFCVGNPPLPVQVCQRRYAGREQGGIIARLKHVGQ